MRIIKSEKTVTTKVTQFELAEDKNEPYGSRQFMKFKYRNLHNKFQNTERVESSVTVIVDTIEERDAIDKILKLRKFKHGDGFFGAPGDYLTLSGNIEGGDDNNQFGILIQTKDAERIQKILDVIMDAYIVYQRNK